MAGAFQSSAWQNSSSQVESGATCTPAFYSGAFQSDAFQTCVDVTCTPAFNPNAFQTDAFQTCVENVCTPAFNPNAFQDTAFQVCDAVAAPTATITGGWSDWMPRKPRRKDEDDEKPAPRKVVTTDKVVTGVVQYEPPRAVWPKFEGETIPNRIARMENESRVAYRKRIQKIIAADDEWLMLH
jgi:hypothetical protein